MECWSFCFFFFFSSRRRHTRLTCDWSSDCALPICVLIHFFKLLGSLVVQQFCCCPFLFVSYSDPRDRRSKFLYGCINRQRLGAFLFWQSLRSEERRVGKECSFRWWAYLLIRGEIML